MQAVLGVYLDYFGAAVGFGGDQLAFEEAFYFAHGCGH